MTEFPITWGAIRPNAMAAMYLRALADEFASLSLMDVASAEEVDWEAVSGALEHVSDNLTWIRGRGPR